jgi:hypothetical protein
MNYRILGHSLEVQGLCPLCRNDDEPGTIPDAGPEPAARRTQKRSDHRDA